ncbi:MAG: AAA family ATPase [Candidatus Bathyarchaeia archaeon]
MEDSKKKIDKTVLGIVGMPGAGKTTAAKAISDLGYPVLSMGDIVREEALKRGLKLTADVMNAFIHKIRQEEGPTIVAEKCLAKCRALEAPLIAIEGIRSLEEVLLFRKSFKHFVLVAIKAPMERRFQNLRSRGREDDPKCLKDLEIRDSEEKRLGLFQALKAADVVIDNVGGPEDLKEKMKLLLGRLGFGGYRGEGSGFPESHRRPGKGFEGGKEPFSHRNLRGINP